MLITPLTAQYCIMFFCHWIMDLVMYRFTQLHVLKMPMAIDTTRELCDFNIQIKPDKWVSLTIVWFVKAELNLSFAEGITVRV